jgi:hypothetical protein
MAEADLSGVRAFFTVAVMWSLWYPTLASKTKTRRRWGTRQKAFLRG